MTAIISTNPDELKLHLQKHVRVLQHNNIVILGRLQEVNISDTSEKPSCLLIEHGYFKSRKVGNLRRDKGPAMATVYLQNVTSVEIV